MAKSRQAISLDFSTYFFQNHLLVLRTVLVFVRPRLGRGDWLISAHNLN